MGTSADSSWPEIEQVAAKRLERHGHRLTGPRFEALRRLYEESQPITIVELQQLPAIRNLHRATFYRAVETLESLDLVKRTRFRHDDEDRFELGDALRPHHHHLVCEGCGTVKPVHAEPRRPKLPRGFRLHGHHLEFYGRCARCAKGAT